MDHVATTLSMLVPDTAAPELHRALSALQDSCHACTGYPLHMQTPILQNYPLHIHGRHPEWPFRFDLASETVRACLPGPRCLEFVFGGETICRPCAALVKNNNLTKMQERSFEHMPPQANIDYLSSAQLRRKVDAARAVGQVASFAALGHDRKMSTLVSKLDEVKHMTVLLAENKFARVHILFARMQNEGRTVNWLVEMLKQAAANLYKSASYDEEDWDHAVLTLRLGGSRLVYAQSHSSQGGPSARAIAQRAALPRYVSLHVSGSNEELMTIIRGNFERFFFSRPASKSLCLHHILMDDIKGSKRVRVDERDGCVRGICWHGVNTIDPHVKTWADAQAIRTALDNGVIHHGTEITNIGIAANAERGHKPIIVATSAGCLSKDPPERTQIMLEMVARVYILDERGQAARGPLVTLQPDGASGFVKLSHQLFFSEKMAEGHPLFHRLSPLVLFHLGVSSTPLYRGLTAGCEGLHVGKRVRERAKGVVGVTISKHTFIGDFWRKLIKAAGMASAADTHRMFATGFADAQRVAPMVLFFRTVARMRTMRPDDFGERKEVFAAAHKEIRIFAEIAYLFATILADKQPSLTAQLTNVATLAHLVFVLYRRNATKFVASQTYLNQQRFFRSIFWSVASALEAGVKEYFMYQDSGDALENVYCILRTMHAGTALDQMQHDERMASSMQVDAVYGRRPELEQKAPRLTPASHACPAPHDGR